MVYPDWLAMLNIEDKLSGGVKSIVKSLAGASTKEIFMSAQFPLMINIEDGFRLMIVLLPKPSSA